MSALLASYGLRLRADIEGDGACQFRSVADLLFNDQEQHYVVRTAACDWLRDRETEEISPGDAQTQFVKYISDASWAAYVLRMRNATEWGDHLTLIALADAYRLRINVLSDVPRREVDSPVSEIVPLDGVVEKTIWLAHYSEFHYVSIEPTSTTEFELRKDWKADWVSAVGSRHVVRPLVSGMTCVCECVCILCVFLQP